jgi:hypothetical protein
MSQALQPQRRDHSQQQFPGPPPSHHPQLVPQQQQQDYTAPQFSAPPIGTILPHINNIHNPMNHQQYPNVQPNGMPMPNGMAVNSMQPNGMQHNGQQYMGSHMMPQASQNQMMHNMAPAMAGQPIPPPRTMDPVPFERNGKKYLCRLEVRQQPVRARMCGFGDKVCSSVCYLVSARLQRP